MKKTMMQLIVAGLVLACATAVFAASQTTVLQDCNGTLRTEERGIHKNANGYVTIQTYLDGSADVTVQLGQAAKLYKYVVRSHGEVLGTFTTDRRGSGGGTFRVSNVSALSQWVAVWETNLRYLPDGTWDVAGQLLCAWNPFFVPSTP